MDWQAAWRVVIRNLPGLLVTSIFVFVGVVIGLMLCIVPGIVFGLLCAFTVPVILLEKKSGTGLVQEDRPRGHQQTAQPGSHGLEDAEDDQHDGNAQPIGAHELDGALDGASSAISSRSPCCRIPIIGLVLLYQDIVRSRMNVTAGALGAQE